ncbi:MAG: threonylcarbamoyl-AMP synthase [Devosiaceae bacterium]|nr:threonylcarbamoyl-AMP synthase [Devosiaceae bacterium]
MSTKKQNQFDLDAAVAHLQAGKVCAFPTDTVFGLGACANSSKAVSALFEIKKRRKSQPIVALCADFAMAETLVEFSPVALRLARLWPGALTLVLPRRGDADIAPEAYAGLDSLGIRIPDFDLVVALITAIGVPLATTSANISGAKTLENPHEIANGFDVKVPLLSHPATPSGKASTILKVEGDQVKLLREGALELGEIEAVSGIRIIN